MAEDELQNLWKDLNLNPMRMSAEEVRRYAEALRRQIRKRHVTGVIAGTMVILGYLAISFLVPNLWFRVGALLMIIWAGFSFRHMWLERLRALPGDMETKGLVHPYRGELMRQKDLYFVRPFAFCFCFQVRLWFFGALLRRIRSLHGSSNLTPLRSRLFA